MLNSARPRMLRSLRLVGQRDPPTVRYTAVRCSDGPRRLGEEYPIIAASNERSRIPPAEAWPTPAVLRNHPSDLQVGRLPRVYAERSDPLQNSCERPTVRQRI